MSRRNAAAPSGAHRFLPRSFRLLLDSNLHLGGGPLPAGPGDGGGVSARRPIRTHGIQQLLQGILCFSRLEVGNRLIEPGKRQLAEARRLDRRQHLERIHTAGIPLRQAGLQGDDERLTARVQFLVVGVAWIRLGDPPGRPEVEEGDVHRP